MGRSLYIQDTCQVIVEDIKTNEILAIGCASATGLNLTETVTPVRGGIGNKICYHIKSEKGVELSISSNVIMHSMFSLMTGGTNEEDVASQVREVGFIKVTDDGTGKKQIEMPTELVALTTVRLEDITGKQENVPLTLGKGEVPPTFKAVIGDELMFYYLKDITGSKFTLDATKFSNRVKVTYKTLAYDTATEQVYSDIWWEFPSVTPNGTLDLTMTAGEATTPQLTFTAVVPKGSDVLAYKYEQVRPEFA